MGWDGGVVRIEKIKFLLLSLEAVDNVSHEDRKKDADRTQEYKMDLLNSITES